MSGSVISPQDTLANILNYHISLVVEYAKPPRSQFGFAFRLLSAMPQLTLSSSQRVSRWLRQG